jgi:hypothetical protein
MSEWLNGIDTGRKLKSESITADHRVRERSGLPAHEEDGISLLQPDGQFLEEVPAGRLLVCVRTPTHVSRYGLQMDDGVGLPTPKGFDSQRHGNSTPRLSQVS